MTPEQAASVEQFLNDSGLAESWHRPPTDLAHFVAEHPDSSTWSPADFDVFENLATTD